MPLLAPGKVLESEVVRAGADGEVVPSADVATLVVASTGSVSEDCSTFEVTSGKVNCWWNGFLLLTPLRRLR